ncbi:MAG: S-methyl-5-thioribose-1-phosphate isomerase [Synergistales bacterium]|nr:S-methyl-5-thioribose-1-phosphate isomerase [Synergistales bacterium]MDY6401351.1 S-methyl-5-thioribose-1-phosphate isomerase [Synergistales bacterium]MDY6405199.1 S-methyl-5-thioribose-1-phosphate isomerase [Synergistales bacterium]MDY6410031.1 S-methyl-5-thioribose-1-phosphate isomerase [Synergistales bacterium]MDY6414985.1 S-methyl-5-thioribose-1-phosphate isomerase [Synergistales bacterium]
MNNEILNYESVALDDDDSALVILDQTELPGEIKILCLKNQKDIWQAIYKLQVRGAPAIGIAASFGLYLAAKNIQADDYEEFFSKFHAAKEYLNSSRPTAVNLSWALNRLEKVLINNRDKNISEIKKLLRDEAVKIKDEDILMCRKIGEYGLTLIKDGDGILTHCNAGQLATSKYGTALAPIHLGRERGMNFKVYCDETRPLLQGARLSTFELIADGVDTTLICDNMASQVMKNGWINVVFVGCDRVAANGDACNKIGTSGLAVLAKYYDIPFYVLGPTSTIDMSIKNGREIIIEQRPAEEVTEMWYKKRMAPKDVKVYNPAFDVTDNELITGIVTEYGIAKPPYSESLKKIFDEKN